MTARKVILIMMLATGLTACGNNHEAVIDETITMEEIEELPALPQNELKEYEAGLTAAQKKRYEILRRQ